MIVALNGWRDLAHINEGIKKAGIMPAKKNKKKTKKGK
ncbi:hypothetical protein HmCmsJML040_03524 [Escherichia coli]|nr:hypothetical protein HmCmsJML040_03524 [Escherichia coli]